jgi:hypothetical protein
MRDCLAQLSLLPLAQAAPAAPAHIQELREDGVPLLTGEFWTAGQRQANNLHEVSYRACFKPQLPKYFIERYTQPGDTVFDPFSGRGTTAVEAALLGRAAIANDVNPLARVFAEPRLDVPEFAEVAARLQQIAYKPGRKAELDLSMFYEAETESEIVCLRDYLLGKIAKGEDDRADRWIRMVATNRLTGHSPGFFSVYSFPPNQAVTAARQTLINQKRSQQPAYRDTKAIILKKSRKLLSDLGSDERENLRNAARTAKFLTGDARELAQIPDQTVQLTVTSPPFLDVVQYAGDNWLRGWFNGLPVEAIAQRITMSRTVAEWSEVMASVLRELHRITRPGGFVAFEVGEVRKGSIKLEEHVLPLGIAAGFKAEAVLLNQQQFTKTSNLWGVKNNDAGTNSNRIVLFRRG